MNPLDLPFTTTAKQLGECARTQLRAGQLWSALTTLTLLADYAAASGRGAFAAEVRSLAERVVARAWDDANTEPAEQKLHTAAQRTAAQLDALWG